MHYCCNQQNAWTRFLEIVNRVCSYGDLWETRREEEFINRWRKAAQANR